MQHEKQLVPKLRFPKFYNEWKKIIFEDLFTFSTGKNIKQSEASPDFEIPCVRYGELYHLYSEVITSVINKTNLERSELLFSKGDEILLPSAGEDPLDIGSASALPFRDIAIGRTINILRPKIKDVYSQTFVSYFINQKLKKKIATLAKGVSISNVYNSDLKKLKINLPILPEQQKIANFLSALDDRIQALEKKKTLLEHYKKGVMQKIFKQELRFKDDDGKEFPEWEEKRLGDFLIHKSKRNKKLEINQVLSVSNSKGFILQSEQFDNHRVASKDVANYKIVEKNDIAYNPSRINVGSIATLKDYDKGIVSPMYVIFGLKNSLDLAYFENLTTTYLFNHLVKVGCSGSVRDSLNFEDLESFKLNFPCLEEQQKIASFLMAIDKEIEIISTQIEQSKTYKKGLLQQIFV
ncbi:restriction endonuclease subunit S [Euzebyella marina]|uniref:Restriction endonuclease subunit S n=1 Tax=Euzebyella marina TaxID=1761453 RepID=A0A3G2L9Z1_9FLAO|nr:restriction endonuclease subunit S [Euzebyella marina]AYN69067.1 restriction endonuclease subunit S [Euzebyella marina]